MIIAIRNLKLIARSGNFRPLASGVFEKQGAFYINCCHGGDDGTMSLEIRDKTYEVQPKNMRKLIYYLMGIEIPKKSPITIHPCFPSLVQKRYRKELKKHNITIIGDWDTITYFCPAALDEFFYSNNKERLIMTASSFDLFLSDNHDDLEGFENPKDALKKSDIVYN